MPSTKNSQSNIDMQNNISGDQNHILQINDGELNVHELNFYSAKNDAVSLNVHKEEMSFQKELIFEIIKGGIGIILGLVSQIVKDIAEQASSLQLYILFLSLLLIGGACVVVSFLNIEAFLKNRNREKAFKRYTLSNYKIYHFTGEKLYRIRGIECPYCEVSPKGFMSIHADPNTKKHEWICNSNPDHSLPFDPMKRF